MDSQSAEARFRSLFGDNYRSVVAYFERRIGSDEAFDAADDVFLVAWRRLDDIPSGDRARPWLFGVARNVLANRRRGSARFGRLLARLPATGAYPVGNPEPVVIQRAEEQAVLNALETLRQQDRELLRLAAWEELPHREIGEILGCSRKAVDARVHRAIQALAKAMARSGHVPDGGAIPSAGQEEQC